jgi:hypothetical protein
MVRRGLRSSGEARSCGIVRALCSLREISPPFSGVRSGSSLCSSTKKDGEHVLDHMAPNLRSERTLPAWSPHSRRMAVFCSFTRPFRLRYAGDSVTKGQTKYCIADNAKEMKGTKRHCVGVASPKPMPWVTMMPITMESCVRTPK